MGRNQRRLAGAMGAAGSVDSEDIGRDLIEEETP